MTINTIQVTEGRIIPLTRGLFTIVDEDDFFRFGHLKWHARVGSGGTTFYAIRRKSREDGRGLIRLHRAIMQADDGDCVDHKNGNTLDNRKSNLRICTTAENGRNRVRLGKNNTSGFKGVFRNKRASKWFAQIKVNGKQIYLGTFDSIKDAVVAYDAAAIKFHKEFASINRR